MSVASVKPRSATARNKAASSAKSLKAEIKNQSFKRRNCSTTRKIARGLRGELSHIRARSASPKVAPPFSSRSRAVRFPALRLVYMTVASEAPPRGLTSSDAQRRLRETGPNELVPARKSNSLLAWVLRLIADPMVILLVIAGGTYFALGDRFDGVVVLIALAPIFLVGAILEYRSDRALERLSDIAPPR